MKYLSITQTAERWGISTRRIQILCGEGRVPGALARSGGFQRTQRSRRTRESRTGSISRSPPKTKNEPQIISATLTRKGDTPYPSRVRIDAAGSAGTFSPSDTGKVIYDDSFLLYDAWRKSVWQR